MKQWYFFFLLFLVVASCNSKKNKTDFLPQNGDLMFMDMDCGGFCDAIEKVTFGTHGAKFSHIAMVTKDEKGKNIVLEAVSKGVKATPLDSFLQRGTDANGVCKVVVGRLQPTYKPLIARAIAEARQQVGKPYDEVFDLEDDTYYCSELVYESFKRANLGLPVFEAQPMTFKDPDTKQTFPIWAEYYKNLQKEIPEGKLGVNPGAISRSEKINIVFRYGNPTGWKD